MASDTYNSIRQHFQWLLSFSIYFTKRLKREHITVVSGYLSYVTLMSLVPFIIVMLSIMTVFPVFTDMIESVELFIYRQFVPSAGDVIQQYLTGFVENASKMSTIAISFLFVAALLLISAIDSAINKIWRVTQKRRFITAFAMYWMVLTFGPILVGISIAATSNLTIFVNNYGFWGINNIFLQLVPWLTSFIAFIVLYTLVPNIVVPVKYAAIGACFAATLFELAKKSFALYIIQVPSYEAIYGALSTIPILFLWVYLSWLIALSGSVLTVSLQNYQQLIKSKPAVFKQTKIR